jgi:hypothetical protein
MVLKTKVNIRPHIRRETHWLVRDIGHSLGLLFHYEHFANDLYRSPK